MDNDDELWPDLTAINLLGPVRVSHAFLKPIIEAGTQARIINIASDAGRVGSTGETVYAATKGGVIAFTKSLAREMARHRINVNCVCPGPTDTPLLETMPERLRENLEKAIPFRRLAQPEEIADAVAVLRIRPGPVHHRAGAQRQRWTDDGGVNRRLRCASQSGPPSASRQVLADGGEEIRARRAAWSRYSVAPSRRAASAWWGVASAVTTTTGRSGCSPRRCCSTSSPLMSGRWRSSTIRSGRCWRASSSPSVPCIAGISSTPGWR